MSDPLDREPTEEEIDEMIRRAQRLARECGFNHQRTAYTAQYDACSHCGMTLPKEAHCG